MLDAGGIHLFIGGLRAQWTAEERIIRALSQNCISMLS